MIDDPRILPSPDRPDDVRVPGPEDAPMRAPRDEPQLPGNDGDLDVGDPPDGGSLDLPVPPDEPSTPSM